MQAILKAQENSDEAAKILSEKHNVSISASDIKQVISCDINDIPEDIRIIKPLDGENNTIYMKIYYIGTHITGKSIEAGIPYKQVINGVVSNLSNNCFWPVLSEIYGTDFSNDKKTLLEQCQKCNFGVVDLYGKCKCFGSSDGEILKGTEERNPYFVELLESGDFDLLVFNGKSTYKLFKKMYGNIVEDNRIIGDLISTSGAAAKKIEKWDKESLEEKKKKEWASKIPIKRK